MQIKFRILNSYKTIVILLLIAFIYCNCASDGGKKKSIEDNIDESIKINEELEEDFNQAKIVLYSLPSPIETIMLIKRAGAVFYESYLNPVENASNYSTSKSLAINLGIYSADLSYASLFDQTQTSIKYMAVSKKLADELGILEAIDENIAIRLENNVNDRDSILEIISETFMNSNSFLKENERPEIATMIIVGGWIEGLYIATQLAKITAVNNELIDRIIDQKLSLNTLMSLMDKYKSNPNIQSLIEEIKELKDIYDKIQVISSKIETETDKETKITTLKAKTDIFISEEVFDSLTVKVKEIRTNFVK